MDTAAPTQPDVPERASRQLTRVCARIADSSVFNTVIFGVIVLNAIVLGLQTYETLERDVGDVLDALDTLFLGIFVVEIAIRVAAFGSRPQRFFRSGWNVFDFIAVGATFLPGLRENATLLRLARLARILRVVRVLPDLRVLIVAIGRSLPGVASLSVIAVLMIYVYGMIGWVVFAEHDPAGYGTIGEAMLTQFLLLTTEGLPERVAMGLELSGWTVLYYASYTLIAAFLLLNILIGVVINSLDEAHEIEARRDLAERRAAAAVTTGTEDDRDVAIIEHLAALRSALDRLEREVRPGPFKHH